MEKIKSLEEQLVKSITKVKILTRAKNFVEPNSKEIFFIFLFFYIPSFKRNSEEKLKTNIVRIDKGKILDFDTEISKPMSKSPPRLQEKSEFVPTCYYCHVVGHIKPNCLKLSSLSISKVRSPSRKSSNFKTTHVCHHCGASGHACPNCFKLFSHKRVSNRSHPLSKGHVLILGELLKVLSFLT